MTLAGVEPLTRPAPAGQQPVPDPPGFEFDRRRQVDLRAREQRVSQERAALERERAAFRAEQQRATKASRPTVATAGGQNWQGSQIDHLPIERTKASLPVLSDSAALAAAIIRMGKIRRGELAVPPLSVRTARTAAEKTAALILAAAEKSRNPEPRPLPGDPMAKALVFLNWQRRGSLDAAGERWLSDYFGGREATRQLLE